MFSVNSSSFHTLNHLPSIPSPLASRDVHVCPSFTFFMSSIPKGAQREPSKTRIHRHPLIQRRAEEPERRRQAFLNRVKDAGEDKRWQTRSDQILRKDFLSKQKQWENDLERSAPQQAAAFDEGDEAALGSSKEVEMIEDVLIQEDQEIEALVSLMDCEATRKDDCEHAPSEYGSDEEDFDRICIEAATPAELGSIKGKNAPDSQSCLDHDMDLSLG